MPALMLQGCGSDVGKSVLVAGLCRLFTNRGMSVRPFKPQNMSNNAAVTVDGGEIGRAQALQARACRVDPTVDMNPVLLKPERDTASQLIVRGKRVGVLEARRFREPRHDLLSIAVESFRSLEREADLVVVEGAGSPAETNLRAHDIANMGVAHAANVPVVLIGDISRGHVIASLVGAHTVLDAQDRSRIQGFIVNKFRGDPSLFDEGIVTIEQMTGWRSFGVVPWLLAAARLPAEDAASLAPALITTASNRRHIAVLRLPHMANFDDFDPLALEPGVTLTFIHAGTPIPADATIVIIPGTKATIADLAFLREQGWDIDIAAHIRRGGGVLGICGGYQMLGKDLSDPDGIEGATRSAKGLGLLDVTTTMTADKTLKYVTGHAIGSGQRFNGYEMHLGVTTGPAAAHPLLQFDDGSLDGAISPDGRVMGCYVHGLFTNDTFRGAFLSSLGASRSDLSYESSVDAALDEIASSLEQTLDIESLWRLGVQR
jgi:adenosylcobyric acid synthase